MKTIADLHIHSRFSRACSDSLNIENLEKYARIKGLNLLGTGDFTHPLWMKELKEMLADDGSGILKTSSGFPFLLSSEIANIFTQDGKGRRIHSILLAPGFEVAGQISEALSKRGRVDYDGRPIFGFSCIELVEMMKGISSDIEIIPAHCLLPDAIIHTYQSIKPIKDIKEKDIVLTHRGNFKKVVKTFRRDYHGVVYNIIPWYFREGLTTTPEHPFFAIKSKKGCSWIKGVCKPLCSERVCCKKRFFEKYIAEWVPAKDLEKGDFLVYPRIKRVKDKVGIRLSSNINSKTLYEKFILPKAARNWKNPIKDFIKIDKKFCLLLGYYLSEGYLVKDGAVAFSFNSKEREYINEVVSLMNNIFGIKNFKIDARKKSQADIIFHSRILNEFFRKNCYSGSYRAWCKTVPGWVLLLPKEKLAEVLRGWWRGDFGYTASRNLANQMKLICLKLGIIPSISIDFANKFNERGKHFVDGRKIIAQRDMFVFSNLSFFEEDFGMLSEECFRKFINKIKRKHGWIDENYVYLPIRKKELRNYKGKVFNLEVEEDNSFVSEFACIHNCWTPWYGIFGSMSGFDSLKECFREKATEIHAIETGMSSNPEMNWHISELNNRAIVSFSDSHSFWPWRIGREATIFSEIRGFKDVINQIRGNKILGTIETDPAYGKYHWDGHRACNFSCPPEQSKKLKGMCPVCSRPLTIGVEYRVDQLSDQAAEKNPHKKPFHKLLPLHEAISAINGSSPAGKKTWQTYNSLVERFGSELNVLLETSAEDLKKVVDEKLADLIVSLREGRIKIQPGYDGVYGHPVLNGVGKTSKERLESVKNPQKGLGAFLK
jgi:uncharacterized protein (TIGR00375 family)